MMAQLTLSGLIMLINPLILKKQDFTLPKGLRLQQAMSRVRSSEHHLRFMKVGVQRIVVCVLMRLLTDGCIKARMEIVMNIID